MTIKVEENRLHIGNESYAIEKLLCKKLDRVIKGITQKHPREDALLINEGKEGKGKTNSSIVEAAYVKAKTKKDVHLFFRIEELMKFAASTKEKIIIWDEPSLDSLSTDQLNKLNRDMQRLFMTIRKKRHFFIINFTKFWKFPEYIVVDRANGMLHMRENRIGRFLYIRKKNLEFLWNQYRTKKRRDYNGQMSFGGTMPDIMEKHFDELGFHVCGIKNATYEDYENEKDKAILSIGQEKKQGKDDKTMKELIKERIGIAKVYKKIREINSGEEMCRVAGIEPRRVREWTKLELMPNIDTT